MSSVIEVLSYPFAQNTFIAWRNAPSRSNPRGRSRAVINILQPNPGYARGTGRAASCRRHEYFRRQHRDRGRIAAWDMGAFNWRACDAWTNRNGVGRACPWHGVLLRAPAATAGITSTVTNLTERLYSGQILDNLRG